MAAIGGIDSVFTNYASAAANGASIGFPSGVASGKTVRMIRLIIAGSVAGRYTLYDSGPTTMYDGILAANTPLVIEFGDEGWLSRAAGANNFALFNETGGVASMSVCALYRVQ